MYMSIIQSVEHTRWNRFTCAVNHDWYT